MVELREMDRRSWLWRRKSADKASGDTESSGSLSSHSERFSDDQETSKLSPNHVKWQEENSPNVGGVEVNERVKSLSEKLSAAFLNISAKEDLVKQHAKVAEEAVSGWEKAESEATSLKQQLEATTQQKSVLEDRVSHLDAALKECVRQLRQAREEQEQKIHETIVKKTREWDASKFKLENQLAELGTQLQAAKTEPAAPVIDLTLVSKVEATERENTALKHHLVVRAEELETMTLELELSTRAAETASKQHLESIKRVAKLEAECRRLRAVARKASALSDHRPITVSSVYMESLTDSQSDNGDRFLAVEMDMRELNTSGKSVSLESNDCEPSCSGSWASALIAELDQFKNMKPVVNKNLLTAGNIDLMDDFLEMERFAALPAIENGEHWVKANLGPQDENGSLKAELEAMREKVAGLSEKLQRLEAEKAGLEKDLAGGLDEVDALRSQLMEAEQMLLVVREQLVSETESKQAVELEMQAMGARKTAVEAQLEAATVEMQRLYVKVESLESEVEEERSVSARIEEKCQSLEGDLKRKKCESENTRAVTMNAELQLKQENELVSAAGKLAECQKTIASLGRQLKSLASFDDFLLDTDKPELNRGSLVFAVDELRKMYSDDSGIAKSETNSSNVNKGVQEGKSPVLSSSSPAIVVPEKNKNGFGKFFSRSRSSSRTENK